MTREDRILARFAAVHLRRVAEALRDQLAAAGIAATVREMAAGVDVAATNHGAAHEFGTFAESPRPVVRSVIEAFRAGARP